MHRLPPVFGSKSSSAAVIKAASKSEVAKPGTTRVKNPTRQAPLPFANPVTLVSFESSGKTLFGHLERVDGDKAFVIPAMSSDTISLSLADVSILLKAKDVPGIPATSCMYTFQVGGKARSKDTPEADFFNFSILTKQPSILYVRSTKSEDDLKRVLEPLGQVAVFVKRSKIENTAEGPWQEFWDEADEDASIGVVDTSNADHCALAHRFVHAGLVVSSPVSVPGARAPHIRVKASILRWVKDAECMPAISGIADQLSGIRLSHDLGEKEDDEMPWSGALYDDKFDVQRIMLCWGMLGAWISTAPGLDPKTLSEPLQSYVRVFRAFESMRHGEIKAVDPTKTLKYNCAAKLTAEQTRQALCLFYWAAIHADDETLPVPRSYFRRALELYTSFGHVVLMKRTYNFRDDKKRQRQTSFRRVTGWHRDGPC